MKKKNNKQFIKIIIFAILFVLLTPLIVNFIVETSNFWGFNFINNSNKDTWITFFGSIIGGGATLISVLLTINNQEMQRKIDLAIQYKPVLSIMFDTPHTNTLENFESGTGKKITYNGKISLKLGEKKATNIIMFPVKITNSGKGECKIKCAKNPNICQNNLILSECDYPDDENKLLLLHKGWQNHIVREQFIYLDLEFFYNRTEMMDGIINIIFEFISTDQFEYQFYKNTVELSFKIIYNKSKDSLEIKDKFYWLSTNTI